MELMKIRIKALVLAGVLLLKSAFAAEPTPEAVTLTAADGVSVFGDYYKVDKPKALILLFHQAGSNRGEYTPIAAKLVQEGYSALAIDQRSGGNYFGRSNETVKKLGHSGEYLDAQKDLEAALDWSSAAAAGAPVILWGSSYSSSLVFLVAAKQPEKVAALLSFSPGEYLGGSATVRNAAAKVKIPVFVTSAKDPEEIAEAKKIVSAVAASSKTQFVPTLGGVHGSSTLRQDRNPKGAAENWQAVLQFLNGIH
jgi:dienelactone hydrolase